MNGRQGVRAWEGLGLIGCRLGSATEAWARHCGTVGECRSPVLGHLVSLVSPNGGSDRKMSEVNGTVSCWVSVSYGLCQHHMAVVHVSCFGDKVWIVSLVEEYPCLLVGLAGDGCGEAGPFHGMADDHKKARPGRNSFFGGERGQGQVRGRQAQTRMVGNEDTEKEAGGRREGPCGQRLHAI